MRLGFRVSAFLSCRVLSLSLFFAVAALASVGVGSAQTSGTVTSAPGVIPLGQSGTFTVTFNFAQLTYAYGSDFVTGGAVGQHVTTVFGNTTTFLTGFAEYTFSNTTCGGSNAFGAYGFPTSCTVTVTFTPKVPGARPGALVLKGNYNGNGDVNNQPPLAYVYLNGRATGPQAVFATGTVSNAIAGLTSATAVAVDGGGNLFYTDQGAKTLSKLTAGSMTPTVLVSNINLATGVAVDGVGNVLYGAYGDNKVYKIPYDGSATTSVSVGSPDIGMAVDGSGNVYVAGGSMVSKIAANATAATVLATISGDSIPAVTVNSAGDVFFSDYTAKKIYRIPSGSTTATALTTVDGVGTNELNGPRGMAVDGGGNLYVANQTAQKVLRLASGTWTQTAVLSGAGYSGLALDLNDTLYLPVGAAILQDNRTSASLSYTPIVVNTKSAQQAVTLENDGDGALTISSLTAGTANADAGGAATTCSTAAAVAASAQCVLGVRFAPTQATTTTGTLTITDNSVGSTASTQLVQLTGSTANDPQTITFVPVSPAAPGRSAVLAGTASSGLTVSYVVNSGPATLSVSNGVTTITYNGAGTVLITASQGGNVNYAAATSVQGSVQVVTAPVITFTPPASGNVGTPITLSASSTQSATPVTFSIVSGPGTISGSQLTLTGAGTVVIAADQAGNASYPSAATVQGSVQSYATQTITFTPTTPVAPGTSTVLNASASSSLPVSFAVNSGPATIAVSGNNYTITYNGIGSVLITASQAGNGTYAPAPNVQATVAVVARPVITFSPASAPVLGSSATLTASSTQSATPVTFSIIGGTATLSGSSITYTYAEPVTLQASQAGNANYPAALPVSATVYVVGQTATTSLAATVGGLAANSASAGTVVTLTATVSTGSGSPSQGVVTFCDASSVSGCTFLHVLGTAQLRSGANAGTAVLRVTPGIGPHTFFAIFGPSAAYAKSASAAVPVTVTGSNTFSLISQSGGAGNYTLTGTVVGSLGAIPAGSMSFLDQSNNYVSLGYAPLTPGSSVASISAASHPDVTGYPAGAVTADFDGDGIPDFAVVNEYSNTVSVMKGSGDGAFTVVSSPAVGSYPSGIATADFNGDGIGDLAVVNQGDNTATILLGNGDGSFTASTISVSGYPTTLTVGDFNGDGKADLALQTYGTVNVMLGNGDGTFTTGPSSTGNYGASILTADFNGDGVTDLVVGNGSNISVLLGRGDGSFASGAGFGCGGPIAVGDFNGDGIADIAATSYSSNIVCLYQGNGDGTFTTRANTPSLSGTGYALAAGDFNGDGNLDLAVDIFRSTNLSGNYVVEFLGKGDGTFSATVPVNTRPGNQDVPSAAVVGDFNRDGLADVAVVSTNYNDNPPSYDDYSTVFLSSVSSTAMASLGGVNPTGSGTHSVSALYPGQGAYTASISAPTALTASNLLSKTIMFPALPSPVTQGSTATLGATASNGDPVTYTITAGTAGISGLTVTYNTGGTVQITAYSAATSTYAAATPVSITVNVSLGQAYFNWVPSTQYIYTGTPLGAGVLDATYSLPGTIAYTSATMPSGTPTAATAATLLSAGKYTLSATATPASSNYAVTSASLALTVQNMNVFVANAGSGGALAMARGRAVAATSGAPGSLSSLFNIGTVQSQATTGGGIGAAVDANGFVWSINSSSSGLSKFTDAGAASGSYTNVGLSGASALALDGNSQVVVANGNGQIVVLSNAGAVVSTTQGSASVGGSGVAIDLSGNVWVSNAGGTVDEIIGGAAPAAPLTNAVVSATPGAKP